jgi:hypothetical protein
MLKQSRANTRSTLSRLRKERDKQLSRRNPRLSVESSLVRVEAVLSRLMNMQKRDFRQVRYYTSEANRLREILDRREFR